MANDRFRSLKPTPSMGVALTALVLAASGGAYAANAAPQGAHLTAAHVLTHATKKKKKKQQPSRGARGPRGPRGPRGLTGAAGLAGLAGAKGATGATGATGSAGAPGAAGKQGIQGIQGVTGPAGPSHTTNWLVQNVAPGAGGASGTGVATLATVGPFTLLGKCTTDGTNVYAQDYIRTSQAGSMESDLIRNSFPVFSPGTTDTDTTQTGGQAVAGDIQVGRSANNTANAQFLEGPVGDSIAAMSADGSTYLSSVESNGVIGSGTNATCFFAGYVESNILP